MKKDLNKKDNSMQSLKAEIQSKIIFLKTSHEFGEITRPILILTIITTIQELKNETQHSLKMYILKHVINYDCNNCIIHMPSEKCVRDNKTVKFKTVKESLVYGSP